MVTEISITINGVTYFGVMGQCTFERGLDMLKLNLEMIVHGQKASNLNKHLKLINPKRHISLE